MAGKVPIKPSLNTILQLGQSQKPVMTPQLQQAIKLLNYNAMELGEYIASAVESNPLLEYSQGAEGGEGREGAGKNEVLNELTPQVVEERSGEEGIAHAIGSDSYGLGHASNRQYQGRARYESDYDVFENLSEAVDLRSHLKKQIGLEFADDGNRVIAYKLLDFLTESGWISDEWQGLGASLGITDEAVEAVLKRMQEFDPVGVFARDLKECLSLQLAERGLLGESMVKLLDNLEGLANNNHVRFCKSVGLEADEVTSLLKVIQSLNPKPGSDFSVAPLQEITPDLLLRVDHRGQLVLELNPASYPHICINQRFHPNNPQGSLHFSAEDRRYIVEKYGLARWLIKSVRQRGESILKIGSEIVKLQKGFFEYGVSHLRPLVLKDIANATDLHESTVSRVINGKYISCERGVFELRYFFTVGLPSRSGGAVISAAACRHRIRGMIDGELADSILSDSEIADILVDEGIDIARRTVAKYREGMGIASSVERRKHKNSSLAQV